VETPASPAGTPRAIEVAAGLVFQGGKLLITQRPEGGHLAGLWEFPGGKLEPGESFEVCLARELREELGIEVAVGEELEEITHDYPGKRVRLKFFRCGLASGTPQPLGCQALAWVSAGELRARNFPEADARLLARLERNPGLWG